MARRRHLDALERARQHIEKGYQQLQAHHAGELLAEELRIAQQSLGEITGEVSSDELLGRIFTSFCIGK
jgi:tRNA modification GTPase